MTIVKRIFYWFVCAEYTYPTQIHTVEKGVLRMPGCSLKKGRLHLLLYNKRWRLIFTLTDR